MMLFLSLLILATAANAVRYDGYNVFQVGPLKDDVELKLLQGLIDDDTRIRQIILMNDYITKSVPLELIVSPEVVDRFREILNENNIPFEVVNTDIQKSFDLEMLENQRSLSKYSDISQFAHDAYLNYAGQVSWLQSAAAGSSIASLVNIGKSYQNRDMWVLTINANRNLPSIFIDAGIHAREWISQATTLWIIDEILTGTSTDAQYLRNNYRWYFLPNVNPDGYEYSWTSDRLWRKTRKPNTGSTCVGTDGNRNWDSNWCGAGASTSPCQDTYCGSAAFSEPETKNQRDYLISIRSTTNVLISIHAYSEYWLVPWGGYSTKPSDYTELKRVGDLAATAIRGVNGKSFLVGTPPDILYVASGGTFDWAKEKNSIKYTYSPELRPATAAAGGFQIPASNIIPSGREIFAAVNAVARNAQHKI